MMIQLILTGMTTLTMMKQGAESKMKNEPEESTLDWVTRVFAVESTAPPPLDGEVDDTADLDRDDNVDYDETGGGDDNEDEGGEGGGDGEDDGDEGDDGGDDDEDEGGDDEDNDEEGPGTDYEVSDPEEVLSEMDEGANLVTEDPEVQAGCCKYLHLGNSELATLKADSINSLMSCEPASELECVVNEIGQVYKLMYTLFVKYDDNERTALLDSFLRYRHEVLSHMLLETVGLSRKSTDVSFNTLFPITSSRTPDFIEVEGKKVTIIEVSAVGDVERAQKKKGDTSKGYESKYEKEIRELKMLDFEVVYRVVIFDIKDENNMDHNESLNDIAMLVNKTVDIMSLHKTEFVRREFCTATRYLNERYGKYYKYLFSQQFLIKRPDRFEDLYIYGPPEKPFEHSYERYPISNYVYEASTRLIVRLPGMLDSVERNKKLSESLLVIELDCRTDRFVFKKSHVGYSLDKWREASDKGWKLWICKSIVVVEGGSVVTQRADFEYFDITPSTHTNTRMDRGVIFNLSAHTSSVKHEGKKLLKDYKRVIEAQEYASRTTIYEDGDYESTLLGMMSRYNDSAPLNRNTDFKVKPFCDSVVGDEMFKNAINNFESEMKKANDDSIYKGKVWVKQPFIYPIYSIDIDGYCSLSYKPIDLIRMLLLKNLGEYTTRILSMAMQDSCIFGSHREVGNNTLEEVRARLGEYSKMVNGKIKELSAERRLDNNYQPPKVSDLEDGDAHLNNLKELNKRVREEAQKAGIVGKRIGLIRVQRSKLASIQFKKEMAHYKSKAIPSFYKGLGSRYDKQTVMSQMEDVINTFLGPSPMTSEWDIIDGKGQRDARLLEDLKNKAVEDIEDYYKYLKNVNIYSICEFITKLCHSLLYHSQTSANSSMIAVDNLGYKDVLLVVKGGKKIFGTKKTKLFRLFYPTFESVSKLYSHSGAGSSFRIIQEGGRVYVATPWMNYHETVVTDGLTVVNRLMGFALLSRDLNLSDSENLIRVLFNLILALHNRRQTEMLLHNLRYVFMNCMSYYSSVDQILPELAGFNYDLFQVWVREKIKDNFLCFAKGMKGLHDNCKKGAIRGTVASAGLKHPFLEFAIDSLETLAISVYSTYLMSKAPTSQTLEQVSNLKSMCETHTEYVDRFGDTVGGTVVTAREGESIKSYYDRLFESDFNYDPKYCYLLGKFFSDYLGGMTQSKNLHLKWEGILEENWNSLANTKGLRYKGKDFFGSKGYYVVNKEILEEKGGYEKIIKLLGSINSDMTDHEKEKLVSSYNETYRDRISSEPLNDVVFHVVDKKQRGGKREIFVMDMETKVHQQVIEKYMAYLCKMTPNEMISIPSNRRLQTVHSRVFETGLSNEDHCYLVLDCRKWAPKSVVEKFLIFLNGMKSILPSSFVYHCQNFFYKLIHKRVYTRKHIFDNLNKNDNLKKYTSYFTEDKDTNGYYFSPKYSWVMGIFNYFSSIFHVACQMHISHMLRISINKSYHSECTLHMIAHSDDSAGKIVCEGSDIVRRSLLYYELFMHSANHLISKKKSNVGKLYYEFISILYIGGELLSLLAKFFGIFNFHPTDNGYCYDITDAYSKCIELIMNGATMEQAYIAMKIQSSLIWRFYFNSKPRESSYNLPPAMLGMPDAHPLLVLICGSDADLVRLYHVLSEKEMKVITAINEVIHPPGTRGEGIFKQFKNVPNVKVNPRIEDLLSKYNFDESVRDSWSLKNVNFRNTILDSLQFGLKLNDKNFVASLQDETIVRRISRSYYYRSSLSLQTSRGPMTLKQIRELIFLLKEAMMGDLHGFNEEYRLELNLVKDEIEADLGDWQNTTKNAFDLIHEEAVNLMSHLDRFRLKTENITVLKKTCKPVHIKIQSSTEECPVSFEPSILVSWIKEPKYRCLLPDVKGLATAKSYLDKVLNKFDMNFDSLGHETLFLLARKLRRKSGTEYFCYSNLPAGIREVTTYQDIMLFIAHNSMKDKYIKGLDVQYGKSVSTHPWIMLPDFGSDDIQWTMSFYLMVLSLIKANNPENGFILNLHVNSPEFLCGNTKENLLTLFLATKSYWSKRYKHERYLLPFIHQIECSINNKEFLNSDLLSDTYYYSFIKRQFLVDNVWLGRGRLFISSGSFKCVVNVNNTSITHVTVRDRDHCFTYDEVSYINYCLFSSQLPTLSASLRSVNVSDWGTTMLGVNSNGDYYIGDSRDMVSGVDVDFDLNLHTPLSNLSLGACKRDKRGKVRWEHYEHGDKKTHLITFLPLSPQNSIDQTRDLISNDLNNIRLLSNVNSTPNSFLLDYCIEELEVEVIANVGQIIITPSSTMLYKILRACDRQHLCMTKPEKPRYSHYPAQDGGLLRAMIEYTKRHNDFDFRWDHTLSHEYMSLKSTQPEAFTTELFDNIRASYEKLFNEEDKYLIFKSLSGLLRGDNFDENMVMKVASEWGFIGVQGALDSMLNEGKVENFKTIRYHKFGVLRTYYSKVYMEFNKMLYVLLETQMRLNPMGFEILPLDFGRVTPNNYKLHYMSFMYLLIIRRYRLNPRSQQTFGYPEAFVRSVIEACLDSKEGREHFSNEVSKMANFRTLPVVRESLSDWFILWNTLSKNYEEDQPLPYEIDFSKVKDRNENLIQPYIILKELCSEVGLKFSLNKTSHSGLISMELYNRYTNNYSSLYDGSQIAVKLSDRSELSNSTTPVSKHMFIRHPLSDDFLDSDEYEDMSVELQSREFDRDTYQESIDAFEGKVYDFEPVKRVKQSVRGRLIDVLSVDFKVFTIAGGAFNYRNLSRIRQSGENILVISDTFYLDFFEIENGPIIFKNNSESWFNHTLVNPRGIFVYVFTNRFRDVVFWEKLLGVKVVSKSEAVDVIGSKMTCYRDGSGAIINDPLSAPEEDLNTFYETAVSILDERKGEEELDDDTLSTADDASQSTDERSLEESLKTKLEESGMLPDSIEKYYGMFVNEAKKSSIGESVNDIVELVDYFTKVFSKSKESEMVIEKLKGSFNKILRQELTQEQRELIFQVPLVFGGSKNRKRGSSNKTLKNPYFVSEMEAICPGLIWDLISGNLGISEYSRKRWDNQFKLWGMMTNNLKKNKKGKVFYLNLIKMILTDAKPTKKNDKDDSRWSDLMHETTEILVEGEDSTSDDEEMFDDPSELSKLNYKVSGVSNV
uniref:RNA-directed RNA polymerase L n=1 Tax=Aulacomnium heterostichum bunyavirus 3 TaxID=2933072 RepID=A0A9C7GX35_9VIRU|nr:RNA-dependent RNA polymerase [Aulacomnium heterostichum bunyavirus 3]CAI5383934.1 RNA-dependent RNA polymerase [Aulacomnium heterostichum bunyavirus 3]